MYVYIYNQHPSLPPGVVPHPRAADERRGEAAAARRADAAAPPGILGVPRARQEAVFHPLLPQART